MVAKSGTFVAHRLDHQHKTVLLFGAVFVARFGGSTPLQKVADLNDMQKCFGVRM